MIETATMERVEDYGVLDVQFTEAPPELPIHNDRPPVDIPEFIAQPSNKSALSIIRSKKGDREIRLLRNNNYPQSFIIRVETRAPFTFTDSDLVRPRGGKKPFSEDEAKQALLELAQTMFPDAVLHNAKQVKTYEIIL